MIRNKRKKRTLTFTILSNDANKVVTRFQIPRIIVYIVSILAIIPIILLFYFLNVNAQTEQEKIHLSANLNHQTNKVITLQSKVDSMKEKKAEVQAKMVELKQLESEMREYITELPDSIGPSGGINLMVSKEKIEQSDFIKRYKKKIDEIEQTNIELKHLPTIWPTVSHSITSNFGLRSDPFNRASSLHTGIDIKGSRGTPVYAGADGTVIMAEHYGGYGNAIKIRHSDKYVTLYGHLSEIKVKQGDSITKGNNIGSIGSTGRSTGPHLHYEIIEDGEPINPLPFMNIYNEENE